MPRFWSVVKNVTRVGLAGAAVKITYDQGVWDSSTDKGRRIFEQAKQKILPGTIEYPKQLPTCRDMKLSVQSSWNKGVQNSFYYIKNGPEEACRVVEKLSGTGDKR